MARRAKAESAPVSEARIPGSTYRLQLNQDFTFRDAAAVVPYLAKLGITDVYTSPYLKSRSGSTHGYDVADPSSLNPELGSQKDYETFVAVLREHGLGQLVDVVPNHMGIGDPGNFRWIDLLENGPASAYARFFDVNWEPLAGDARYRGKVVLPTLGDQYGRVLEQSEFKLVFENGAFGVDYFHHRFPVAPDTWVDVLGPALEIMADAAGRKADDNHELASIVTSIRHLPPREPLRAELLDERTNEIAIVKRRLRDLHKGSAAFRRALDTTLADFNGTPGEATSFNKLDALLDQQSYRLAFWRVAADEINYRRFFDVTELAAVRMEEPAVFAETHALLLRLIAGGGVTGLRIDHPDGLFDPKGYFAELQRACYAAATGEETSPSERPFYVVGEKILTAGEHLPKEWAVHGTTGYDFLAQVNGLFVERRSERAFTALYQRFTGTHMRYADIANANKKLVMLVSVASEINELGYQLRALAGQDRRFRDFTLPTLTFAIREVIAALGVYRTYVDPRTGLASDADRADMERATAEARRRNPRTDPSIFDFIRDAVLLPAVGAELEDDEERARREQARLRFVARLQQTSGAVMAKGVEDTSFYVYNRLVSLNEVGGEPSHFGSTVEAFHRANRQRLRDWPDTMLGTSTHDTKRSEDVRARLNVLSEMPREWERSVRRWSRLNASHRTSVDGGPAPDRNDEYLIYQLLLGAWPLGTLTQNGREEFRDRVTAATIKSVREAKVHTSWVNTNAGYEDALTRFIAAIMDPKQSSEFMDDFLRFSERVSYFGAFNSLSQTLLKLTVPGVPDIYQGNDLWDFSLVDPDNRRPVDFPLRERLLGTLAKAKPEELLREWEDGRIKQLVTHRALGLRRELPEFFRQASYTPLVAEGPSRRHVAAFERELDGQSLIVIAPVLVAGLTGGDLVPPTGDVWRSTSVPLRRAGPYRDVLSGRAFELDGRLRVADALANLPVALLRSEAAS